MLRRAYRALRLGYYFGRAALHACVTPVPVGPYCLECNSVIERGEGGRVVIRHAGRPCPVHVAWRELIRAGAEP